MKQDAAWASSLGVSGTQLNEWKALAEGHLSLLVWCLENQKIEEENYLAWAQKNYQVSHLKSDFFKSQPLPFDLFDQYYSLIPKNAIPVTLWDGVVFIASPDPLPAIELDRPCQWVLASWIQIVNWRNQYEKELNAKSSGSSALSSLDFGNLGGEVTKAPAHEPAPAKPAPEVAVAAKEPLPSFAELSFAPPAEAIEPAVAPVAPPAPAVMTAPPVIVPLPPAPQPQSESVAVPISVAPLQAVQKPVAPIAAAAPLKAPPLAGKPAPVAPAAPKVNPPPKISPMPVRVAPVTPAVVHASPPPPPPPAQPHASEENTVIQSGPPKSAAPKPTTAQPRPSSGTNSAIRKAAPLGAPSPGTSSGTQTRSSIPLKPTAGGPPKPSAGGPPKPASTNRPMPQAAAQRTSSMDQTNTKIPRPKVPLGAETDEFTKTGFSKTAIGQTKITRVKLGTDAEQGTATAVRVQRPATTGVVVMDPRFKIDHPKYLKSLDDLPFYLLHRMRDLYDKTMILTFTGGILKPWRWDDSWGHPNDQTQVIPVSDPSMFRIPLLTKTPYHGHVVKSAIHDMFLSEWSPKAMPEHVTILPMMVDGNVTGLVLGVVKQNKVSRIRLEDVESIAHEAGQLLLTLPSRGSVAA